MIVLLNIFHRNFAAMTIWPFIFIKDKSSKLNHTLINHERIHLKQQIELFWFPFFIWYLLEFLVKLIKYKKWNKAYRAISFEKEAFENEDNLTYLKNRKIWSFFKYL